MCTGLSCVHGARAPPRQQGSVRNLVDLHVPLHDSSHEDVGDLAVHPRALQEEGNLPAPKMPTFSVFSALYDSVLGVVSTGSYSESCYLVDLRSCRWAALLRKQRRHPSSSPAWQKAKRVDDQLNFCNC